MIFSHCRTLTFTMAAKSPPAKRISLSLRKTHAGGWL
jgi:hypothetical protein